MNDFFGSLWWLLITLGVLVTFHEFGHFWVGRHFGVKVLRFSVGFGKPVWSRIGRDGTEYAIGGIPLGGYVKFLDEREGDVAPEDLGQAFNRKPVWQRMLIVAAGPVFNIVLCVALLWGMLVIGRPDYAPVIGHVEGITAAAGIQPGDRIVRIDGDDIPTWNDALPALARNAIAHRAVTVDVRGAAGESAHMLRLDQLPARINEIELLSDIGMEPQHMTVPPVVGEVPASGASAGLLQPGDRIVGVNGSAVTVFEDIRPLVQKTAAGAPVQLTVARAGQTLAVAIVPTVQGKSRLLGVTPKLPAGDSRPKYDTVRRLGPVQAVPAAIHETSALLRDSVTMIGRMIRGQAPRESVSGPVTIARIANSSAQMGPAWFLRFLALMSLSLGVLNLLPIPILDGGHLAMYAIEAVRGRPLGERALAISQSIGLMLILGLMGLAFYNDFFGHFH
ncbi:RIP metalloprotease RseP [Solilutibacter silvestris]|uniref:Zinc metalloprotease n=1 Tax=Solilutibacter silvestris TaxID=1645665 RepID=A0A2K1Q3L8_9GAMM|nr:RIP metalloprotease RseP [Lysobacter silvestris]PNS09547.1 RIP metalloprotease RseP [Lysobacter silvestris]